MEHQDPVTQPIGAEIESRPIVRERILTAGPRLVFCGRWHVRGVFSVVEDDLEQPVASLREVLAYVCG